MKHVKKIDKNILWFILLILFLHLGSSSEVYYTWRDVYIGALDATKWAGIVFVPRNDSAFAFHLRVKRGNETAEGIDLFYLISEVGPHSPDGQYARLKIDLSLPFGQKRETPIKKKPSPGSDTLTLEWSRKDERTVVGRIVVPKEIEVQLIHYFPWNFDGTYQLTSNGQIRGRSQGASNQQYLFWTSHKGDLISSSQDKELAVGFAERQKIHFVAGVDDDFRILSDHIYRYKNEGTIDKILDQEKKKEEKKESCGQRSP